MMDKFNLNDRVEVSSGLTGKIVGTYTTVGQYTPGLMRMGLIVHLDKGQYLGAEGDNTTFVAAILCHPDNLKHI